MRPSSRFIRQCVGLGLAMSAATALVAPAHAAEPITAHANSSAFVLATPTPAPSQRPPQKPVTSSHVDTPIAFGAGTSPKIGVTKLVNPPGQENPPTLTIDQVQPAQPVEGQPLQVAFHLTNNSSTWPLTGTVVESGNGHDLFGGEQSITQLAAGATTSGVVSDAAPSAGKGLAITLNFTGNIQDGTPAPVQVGGVTCGDCGGTPTTATTKTQVDVLAAWYIELNSFEVDNTRARHNDTDYAVLTAEQQPSGTTANQSWGPQNVNNGGFSLGPLVLGPYYGLPDDSNALVANYSIVNSGHTAAEDILNAMIQAGIQGAGAAIGTFGQQGSTQTNNSFGGAAGGNILGTLLNGFFANCDGVVAQDQVGPYDGGTLASMTATGPHTERHFYAGTDSANFCGSNSQYYVTWTLTRDTP